MERKPSGFFRLLLLASVLVGPALSSAYARKDEPSPGEPAQAGGALAGGERSSDAEVEAEAGPAKIPSVGDEGEAPQPVEGEGPPAGQDGESSQPPPSPAPPEEPTPGAGPEGPAKPEPERRDCFPACRSGFLCHEGRCLSACNPPCGDREKCAAGGECVPGPFAEYAGRNPSAYRHDGFFLRISFGPGFLLDWFEDEDESGNRVDGEYSGISFSAFFVSIGGTLFDGLVLSVYLMDAGIYNPDYDVEGVEGTSENDMSFFSMGPLVDFYPDPAGGFHFGIAFGLADVDWRWQPDVTASPGWSIFPLVGYEVWIDEQLSFGVLARLVYLSDTDAFEQDHSVLFPVLQADLTYH